MMDDKTKDKSDVKLKEEDIKDVLAKSNISLIIDTYEDIFSDFDPRPFNVRTLSDDFLQEARKIVRGVTIDKLEFNFLIPSKLRDNEVESNIKKRLRDHFKKHFLDMEVEKKKIIKQGIMFICMGFIFMTITTFISFYLPKKILYSFLMILLEPSGWFMVWYGLDQIFYRSKEKKNEIEFYNRMAKANVVFKGY